MTFNGEPFDFVIRLSKYIKL